VTFASPPSEDCRGVSILNSNMDYANRQTPVWDI